MHFILYYWHRHGPNRTKGTIYYPIIADPAGKNKGGTDWADLVISTGKSMFGAIAGMPVRSNPHDASIFQDELAYDVKKNDDLAAVYNDECIYEIPVDGALGTELIEGGYCTMSPDGSGLVANMDEYNDSVRRRGDSEYEYEYEYCSQDEYDSSGDYSYSDNDSDDDTPLLMVQTGLKNDIRLPWTTELEYYTYIYTHARKHKARVLHGNEERFDDVVLYAPDLCYNMMKHGRFYNESDDVPTIFWWIPTRHPIGQMLIRNEKTKRKKMNIRESKDDTLYYWMQYDAFESDTGHVVIFENDAVQEALQTIVEFCVHYKLEVKFDSVIAPNGTPQHSPPPLPPPPPSSPIMQPEPEPVIIVPPPVIATTETPIIRNKKAD